MTSHSEPENEWSSPIYRFVVTELEKALSSLHVASTTLSVEQRERSCRNAEHFLNNALETLLNLTLAADQQASVDATIRQIRIRLKRFQ
jgi:UPF0288 family protein (methanogenesis marker protein 3)